MFDFKNRKKKSKRDTVMKHLKNRFLSRFGIDFQQYHYDSIIAQIHDGRGKHLEKQTNSRHIWLCEIEGKKVVVIYNPVLKMIHTCFPLSWYYSDTWERKNEERKFILFGKNSLDNVADV